MSSNHYTNQREELEAMSLLYQEYLELYCFLNNGSRKGAVSFEKFYWFYKFDFHYSQLTHF